MEHKFNYAVAGAAAMGKKLAPVILSIIAMAQPSMAQEPGMVTGTVTDNANKALAAATISLHRAHDSSLVGAGISDVNGKFELPVAQSGSYLLGYSRVGYEKTYTGPLTVKEGDRINLQTEKLNIATTSLAGVTVAYKKSLMEVKVDKTVLNVENSINATGSTAMELLQKVPGIQTDNDDNISMKGKNGVRIYVDGKMMQLDNKDLAAYLKSINSSDMESIEIINNPGARYDASGGAGVINIRLRKNKKFGTNGSAGLGFIQGITPKGNGAVNVNYRDKKINIFSNIGGSLGLNQKNFDLNRTQKDTAYYEKTIFYTNDKSVNAKAGADYFVNSRNTIGMLATVNYTDEAYNSVTNTAVYDSSSGKLVQKLQSFNVIPGSRTNADFNLNYRYADTSGREINVDADYGLFRGTGRSYQPNYYFASDDALLKTVINRNYAPTNIDIYTVKLDMGQQLGKGRLEYGAKFSGVTTNNTYDFFTNDATGKPFKMQDKSSRFTYTEYVNAAYGSYQWHYAGKLAIQTGLRVEQTNSKGNLIRDDGVVESDNRVKRSYIDFFPGTSITWTINPHHTLNLVYSRRIDRPTYQKLNPFEIKLDELTYIKGNAFLRPQYTDNITLTHTFFGKLNSSVGYSYVKDYATMVTDTIYNALYAQDRNVGRQQLVNFSIGSPVTVTKWWNGYAGFWYSYQVYKGAIGQNSINTTATAFGANMQQQFTLGHDYSAELTGWYIGPGVNLVTWKTRSMGGMDLGIQKLLFHKQASVKLTATDLLYTTVLNVKSNFGGVNGNANVHTESRTVRVNFTWRFGSSQIKSARERHTGLENEAKRIKDAN